MMPKFQFLQGVVKIHISGLMPERFVNLCLLENISLWNIKNASDATGFYASIYLDDFFRIRPLVKKSHNHITVTGRAGLPFILKKMKKRRFLFVGLIFFFILLYLFTSHIWFLEIRGTKNLSPLFIREIVYRDGLKPGTAISKINCKMIENELCMQIPEIAWVSISISGTKACIEIAEKTLFQMEEKKPSNIIADKDGVITEIIVLNGQPAVKVGDTVKKGDILIKGVITPANQLNSVHTNQIPLYVQATGMIKARIWYESYGESELTETIRQRTGQQHKNYTLIYGAKEIPLLNRTSPYLLFETENIHKKLELWRNSNLTVEMVIDIYHEFFLHTQLLSQEEAREKAVSTAVSAIQAIIPETAVIIARNIESINTAETNLVRIKLNIETIEDIGKNVIIE